MPIYEYQCTACQHELEVLRKLSDAPLTECPECHASTLVKKVSAAGFRLTGGGWYETDFKSGNKKNLAGEAANKANDAGNTSAAGSNTASVSSSGATSSPASTSTTSTKD